MTFSPEETVSRRVVVFRFVTTIPWFHLVVGSAVPDVTWLAPVTSNFLPLGSINCHSLTGRSLNILTCVIGYFPEYYLHTLWHVRKFQIISDVYSLMPKRQSVAVMWLSWMLIRRLRIQEVYLGGVVYLSVRHELWISLRSVDEETKDWPGEQMYRRRDD